MNAIIMLMIIEQLLHKIKAVRRNEVIVRRATDICMRGERRVVTVLVFGFCVDLNRHQTTHTKLLPQHDLFFGL